MIYPTRGVYAILESQILSSLRNRCNTNGVFSDSVGYGTFGASSPCGNLASRRGSCLDRVFHVLENIASEPARLTYWDTICTCARMCDTETTGSLQKILWAEFSVSPSGATQSLNARHSLQTCGALQLDRFAVPILLYDHMRQHHPVWCIRHYDFSATIFPGRLDQSTRSRAHVGKHSRKTATD